MTTPALAVFYGTGHFDHCFAALYDGKIDRWLVVNSGDGRVIVDATWAEDLAKHWRRSGLYVLQVEVSARRNIWPMVLPTCVELTKRVLGVSNPLIVTTRQLYRHLEAAHGGTV